MLIPAHCHNYLKKSSFFLPGAASEHLPRTLYTLSAQDLPPFPARQASGIPFRAGNDTFFCPVNRDGYTNREGYLAKFDLHKVFEYEQCSQDIHSK